MAAGSLLLSEEQSSVELGASIVLHRSLLLRLCLHLRTAALRSYVICTHLFRTAAGDLRYRVDHMACKDHVCLTAVCQILPLPAVLLRNKSDWV